MTLHWSVLLALAIAVFEQAAPPPEVRQLVSFKFLPGKSADALALFRDQAVPLYRDNEPMRRFRGFREAESPVPVDLVVVSSFAGMSGMDASNRALRESARAKNTSVGALYGSIGALSQEHRDEFVEIDPALSWGDPDPSRLQAFVRIRVSPGGREAFERLVREALVPWEEGLGGAIAGAAGGRFLVGSGWDYLRVVGLGSLGDWHRYRLAERDARWSETLDALIEATEVMLLVPVPELSVR